MKKMMIIFLNNNKDYIEEILPVGIRKIVIEASSKMPWNEIVFNKKYLPDLKTLTNTQPYNKNSYLVCDENSKVRWEAIDSPNSLIAPKSYVDARITQKEVILESSTGGSSKKFKITVDDTGTIKATEVTNN